MTDQNQQSSLLGKIAAYTEILAKDPKSTIFVSLSEAYRKMGMLADAKDVAERGLVNNPGFAPAHIVLARILCQQGDYQGSEAYFQRALEVDHGSLAALVGYARLSILLGQESRARELLLVARSLSPADSVINKLLLSLPAAEAEKAEAERAEAERAEAERAEAERAEAEKAEAERAEAERAEAERAEAERAEAERAEAERAEAERAEAERAEAERAEAERAEAERAEAERAEAERAEAEKAEAEKAEAERAEAERAEAERAKPAAKEVTQLSLASVTLAELYLKQGQEQKALEMYRQLSVQKPNDLMLRRQIRSLEERLAMAGRGEDKLTTDNSASEVTAAEASAPQVNEEVVEEIAADIEESLDGQDVPQMPVASDSAPGTLSAKDRVVTTLNQWLDNIQQRRGDV